MKIIKIFTFLLLLILSITTVNATATWVSSSSIVSGLGDVGQNAVPTIYDDGGTWKLIIGEWDGVFSGWYWNGSTWVSSSSIVSGLGDVGYASAPTVYNDSGTLKLISGDKDGYFHGFDWNGSTWVSNSSIVSGLGDIGTYSTVDVYNDSGIWKLITGNNELTSYGFDWNGSTWVSNSSIVSGLGVSLKPTPAMYNDGTWKLITGRNSGDFYGFNWNGSTWVSNSSIVSGLSDIGLDSAPTVYNDSGIWKLIAGERDGVFYGWYLSDKPIITFLEQSPSILYQNTTGNFNFSFGITHSSSGLNNSTFALVYSQYDVINDNHKNSVRYPSNNRAALCDALGENVLRADNRNDSLWFESNVTITNGTISEWGGADYNSNRFTVVTVNDTYTKVYWNGTAQDTIWGGSWYLDRTDHANAPMTPQLIDKSNHVLLQSAVPGCGVGQENQLIDMYIDSYDGGLDPTKPVNIWYLNNSFDPNGSVDATDSPYAFLVTSITTTEWYNNDYSTYNSSYANQIRVNSSAILSSGIVPTTKFYVFIESEEATSKSYYFNKSNGATSTNLTFAETGVMWTGTSAPYTPEPYTPNVFFISRSAESQFQTKLYVTDNNGLSANSTLQISNIEVSVFPPTNPSINHFHYEGTDDHDMNGTYSGIFDIGVGVSSDPDGGVVNHNLTLHYKNQTLIDIINNTFTDEDITHNGVFADIEFNSTPYYSDIDEYTLRVIATDDEGDNQTIWLNTNFTLSITPSNYDNFTFTNAQVSPSTILEGKPFTVSVDINDTDGVIATAIVKIDGTNYTMTNSTGDTWTYIFSDTAIPTRYFVQNFYAQDNTSAWNSTTSTLSVIALPSTGTGGFGGMPIDVPRPIPEEEPPEEELIPEEPTDIDSILDVLEEKLSEATNITTIKNIFKSKAVSFIGVKYTVGDYSTTKDIVKPEALTCESTDPRVSCGVMDGVVTIIVMPTTDDSKLYQFTDTYVKITNNDLNVYHLPVSLYLINLMWYFDFNMDTGIENPYIVAYDASGSFTIGLRLWWIGLSFGLLLSLFGLNRKYGGKLT